MYINYILKISMHNSAQVSIELLRKLNTTNLIIDSCHGPQRGGGRGRKN